MKFLREYEWRSLVYSANALTVVDSRLAKVYLVWGSRRVRYCSLIVVVPREEFNVEAGSVKAILTPSDVVRVLYALDRALAKLGVENPVAAISMENFNDVFLGEVREMIRFASRSPKLVLNLIRALTLYNKLSFVKCVFVETLCDVDECLKRFREELTERRVQSTP